MHPLSACLCRSDLPYFLMKRHYVPSCPLRFFVDGFSHWAASTVQRAASVLQCPMLNEVIQRAKAERRQPIRLTAREEYELRRAVVILQDVQGETADEGLFDALADPIDDLSRS